MNEITPEIARHRAAQQEANRLVDEISERYQRLHELMTIFKPVLDNHQRFALMNAGCYFSSLWTRNERDISEAG